MLEEEGGKIWRHHCWEGAEEAEKEEEAEEGE